MAQNFKRQFLLFLLLIFVISGSYFGYLYRRIHRYDLLIAQVAKTYKLDAKLVRSVVYEESYFDPHAHSRAGAMGLMQITPVVIAEWEQTSDEAERTRNFAKVWAHKVQDVPYGQAVKLSTEELLGYPEINLNIGCWYLDHLRQRFEDDPQKLPMMLAGYNAGPSQAERWRMSSHQKRSMTDDEYVNRIDYPETQNYVRRIISRYKGTQGIFDF